MKQSFLNEIYITTYCYVLAVHTIVHSDYNQFDVECIILDGWGARIAAYIHIPVPKHDRKLLNLAQSKYCIGSIHKITSTAFSLEDHLYIYHPKIKKISTDEKQYILDWFRVTES